MTDPEEALDMLKHGGSLEIDGFDIESANGRDKQLKVTYQQDTFYVGPNETVALAYLGKLCHELGERRQV